MRKRTYFWDENTGETDDEWQHTTEKQTLRKPGEKRTAALVELESGSEERPLSSPCWERGLCE